MMKKCNCGRNWRIPFFHFSPTALLANSIFSLFASKLYRRKKSRSSDEMKKYRIPIDIIPKDGHCQIKKKLLANSTFSLLATAYIHFILN